MAESYLPAIEESYIETPIAFRDALMHFGYLCALTQKCRSPPKGI